MNLSTYRPVDRAVDEHLRYISHDGDGVVRTKPNGFLVCYEFRGPDLLGTSWDELTYHADAVARIFASLDSRWTIHISLHHRRGGMYPSGGNWPHPAIYLLDRCRRTRYESDGDHFVSTTRLWLSWHPLSAQRRFVDWVFGEQRIAENDRAEFARLLTNIEASLRPLFREFHRLDFETVEVQGEPIVVDRVAQALGEEMYGRFGMVASDPEEPIFLSHFLADAVVLNPEFKIGDRYVGIVSPRGYPRLLSPAMMSNLRYLPVEFKYSMRIMPYSLPEAGEEFTKISRQHLLATLGLGLILNRNGEAEEEETPTHWRQQVKDGRVAAQAGEAFCAILPQFVVYENTPEERDKATRAIGVALEQCLMAPKTETWVNRFHSYLASLPGERDANELRYARASMRGATRLSPLTTTWQGPERHPDPRFRGEDMPLTMMSTSANEPFRVYLHVDGVGHTLVIGPTGKGKSVLLRAIENAHLARYRGARVLSFDIGRSAYKYAKAINGQHYTLSLGNGPQIAPLTGIDDSEQFTEVFEWVATLIEVWRERPSTIKELDDVRSALHTMQSISVSQGRRLSDLGRVVQSPDIRSIFEQLEGSLLDATSDDFTFDRSAIPYWCFEIGGLGVDNTRWTVPAVLYIQRRAFAEFARGDSVPTIVTIDEGARALKIPRMQEFAERIQREGRKNRIQFLFATQGVSEILKSPIRNVLIEQTVTKIAFPNRDAKGEVLRREYMEIGFSNEDVETIAGMDTYSVLIRSEYGVQVVRLNPMDFELAVFGGASNEDCAVVDSYIEQYGDTAWLSHYLLESGGGDHVVAYADALRSYAASVTESATPPHSRQAEEVVL
jgi:type IV secretory pathway VirB4 component